MPKLFMLLIGCSPKGRHIEQHDIFFGIGNHISDLFDEMLAFWPEAKNTLHIDAWREVTNVNGFQIDVVDTPSIANDAQLFFINLGGYKINEFEEFHYKMVVAAPDKGAAVKLSKQTAFFKHTGFKGANSHIDDKYGIDVDDIYAISDILPKIYKGKFNLAVKKQVDTIEDVLHLGYFRMDNVEKWAPYDEV